jgi:uroporphyrinogen III methyltransferase/synthase
MVYLVGAGPGDVGLLTVKGLKCLRRADVVIYDYHLNAQVMNYINHEAEFIYAGKRGGHHTMTQDEINSLLISKAKEGKTVCRLKGGDPFVFGRGGEEAEALAAEGIEFDVVSGVSSAIAAPAYAGIPLTHRKYSSSFAVIPGYEDTTKEESSIDWSKLATGVGTLVFLMAVKNIDVLTKKLIENGKSPDTPVAVIRWGTRAEQVTITSTLEKIASEVSEKDIKPPAVMVVGDVVRLRDSLKWYEKKPMFGQRILVTRERTDGFERLEDMGAEIIEFPTIEIAEPESWGALDECIKNIGKGDYYEWIIFTSANGVRYFFRRLMDLAGDVRDLKGIRICAVGVKTASEINKSGIRVDMVPGEFNAEGLIKSFTEMGGIKGKRFLMPRAEAGREVLPEKIRELGGRIDVPPAYRALKPELRGKRIKRFLKEGKITIATFTSGATFKNLMEIMGDDAEALLKGVSIAAIGPVTKKTIEKAGLKVDIMPVEATIEAMVEEIIKWVDLNS